VEITFDLFGKYNKSLGWYFFQKAAMEFWASNKYKSVVVLWPVTQCSEVHATSIFTLKVEEAWSSEML
jgi:hypothetical protein